ncbi:platelet basic protein-like [Pantherophis guttatus]|uniref:Platelet basic protein-like n=1 Tax=Pantherophis guttatus TaxID=94885 RepID=A0A6P9C8D5_PANGU|nr:platelet basic protein-like [Pantherophis guttatus]
MGRLLLSASFQFLFLFMVLIPSTRNALPPRNRRENRNRCECDHVTSSISPSLISSIHLIQPGSHCNVLQVIAVLKDGNKRCLDPAAQWVKRIVQVLLSRENH